MMESRTNMEFDDYKSVVQVALSPGYLSKHVSIPMSVFRGHHRIVITYPKPVLNTIAAASNPTRLCRKIIAAVNSERRDDRWSKLHG